MGWGGGVGRITLIFTGFNVELVKLNTVFIFRHGVNRSQYFLVIWTISF